MFGWIILGLVVLLALWLVVTYNRLVALRQTTGQAWSDVDVQLKQRHDLIPNLVETVKGYAAHEKTTLDAVIQARNAAAHAQGPAAAGQAEGVLGAALGRLFALSEAYPDLKANTTMMQLSEELTSTENRVAFSRQAFNDAVMAYNNAREMFPSSIIAGWFSFNEAKMLDAPAPEKREPPKVSFA